MTSVSLLQKTCFYLHQERSLKNPLSLECFGLSTLTSSDRIAIYTGSFDPPHKGHQDVIKGCLELGYRAVLIIPALGPSKEKIDRTFIGLRNLLIQGFCDEEFSEASQRVIPILFKISEEEDRGIEAQRQARERIRNLLRKTSEKGAKNVRVLGGDSLEQEVRDIKQGRLKKDVFHEYLVFSRPGCSLTPLQIEALSEASGQKVHLTHLPTENISSRDLQHHLSQGDPRAEIMLSPRVLKIIQSRGLYQTFQSSSS